MKHKDINYLTKKLKINYSKILNRYPVANGIINGSILMLKKLRDIEIDSQLCIEDINLPTPLICEIVVSNYSCSVDTINCCFLNDTICLKQSSLSYN
jgi:hypothetical protein